MGQGSENVEHDSPYESRDDAEDRLVNDKLEPLVSIVIPFFRGGDFLDEAIESVRNQTYRQWEILLVDNGSKHGFPDSVAQDPRVKTIEEARRGICFARNAGIRAARGPLIALLDEDDRWSPTKLQEQVASLLAAPSAVLSHTSYHVIDVHGSEIGVTQGRLASSYEEFLGLRAGILPSTVVVRRTALDKVGLFDPARQLAEDLDLFLRLLRMGPVTIVREPLVDYRWHSEQVTHDYVERFAETIAILRTARRLSVRDWRPERFLLSLRGEAATRKGYGEVAFHRAGQGIRDGLPTADVVRHLFFGMRTFPFGVPIFFRARREH
jgi:glycosyltransferase involved in cell wall biosynthesis